MNTLVSERPVAAAVDAEEARVRRDLAAFYRLVAYYGWDDLIATHISARLPGTKPTFLINPFGMLFEEVTASSLVKINADGEILAPTPHKVNPAGFVIHSAVHQVREDAGCVAHLHTKDGVAVSMLEEGLLPLNQTSMTIVEDIAFHEYEGVALDMGEQERLQQHLGDKNLMLLRNHGTLAVGGTVAEAFTRMYFLEWACTVQIRAMSAGRALHQPSRESRDKVSEQTSSQTMGAFSRDLVWPAMLRKLERMDPSFAD